MDLQGRNGSRQCHKILSLLAQIGGKVEGMESKMEEVVKELEQRKTSKGPCPTCGHKGNAQEDEKHEEGEAGRKVGNGDDEGVEVGIGDEGVYEVIGSGCENSVRGSQRGPYGVPYNVERDGDGDRCNTPPRGRGGMQMDNNMLNGQASSAREKMALNTALCLDSCPMYDETDDTEETELPATPPKLRDHREAIYGGALGGAGLVEGGPVIDVNDQQPLRSWMQRTIDKQAREAHNMAEDGEYCVNPTQLKKGRSLVWPIYKQLVAARPMSGNGMGTILTPGYSQPTNNQLYDMELEVQQCANNHGSSRALAMAKAPTFGGMPNLNCPPPVVEMVMGNEIGAKHDSQYGHGNFRMPRAAPAMGGFSGGKAPKRTPAKLPDIKPRVPGWVSLHVTFMASRPFNPILHMFL